LSEKRLKKEITAIHCIKIIFFFIIVTTLLFIYFKNLTFFQDDRLFISLIFMILGSIFYPIWFFQYLNETKKIILPTLLSRLFQFFIIYNFLENQNFYLVLLTQGFHFMCITIWGYFYILRKYNFLKKISPKEIISTFNQSKGIFLNNFNQNFSFSLWGVYLIFIGNTFQLSIFNLADTFLRACNVLNSILTEVLLSNFKDKVNKKIIIFFISIFFLLLILFLFSLESFLIFFSKYQFINYIFFFKIVIILFFVISIINILNYPVLGQKTGFILSNKISKVFFLINIVLILGYFFIFGRHDLIEIGIINLSISLIYFSVLLFFIKR
jgi:polysaccharide transporter, PST family